MAVGVDQAGKERAAAAIDFMLDRTLEILEPPEDLLDPSIVVDDQRAEMLKLAVGADLDAIDVVDHRVAVAARCRSPCLRRRKRDEERGQRE